MMMFTLIFGKQSLV